MNNHWEKSSQDNKMARLPVCSCLRVAKKKLLLILVTSVVVYNEWFTYTATTLSWPDLGGSSDDSVRVLFAADPQILSLLSDSEPEFPLNLITIWDANRFVRRGFQMALWKIKPDIVVFLGDLLNDGSIANDSDFNTTLQHFKNLMTVPNYVKHVFSLPGDNDIGGEGSDLVTPHKVRRFYSFLNQSMTLQYKFVDFIQEIIKHKPSFIFSGHDHDSFHFTSTKQDAHAHDFEVLTKEQHVWQYESLGTILHEIAVPTCSYRMGKMDTGYGAAVINKSGTISYTVLWLPSRFTHLLVYLAFIFLIIIILVLPGHYTAPSNPQSLKVKPSGASVGMEEEAL
ncbi:Metallophosphoesterase 1 [Chionoecetes opilio]|uniref:Metallophosphoesterase 1 n=1 Tax=Chionoecetes opilio TaxID=41210 RepID=A0A8J5CLW3_CHIOP|nr:Metallophosphoesterase 1 [Chionoecetes opilio]